MEKQISPNFWMTDLGHVITLQYEAEEQDDSWDGTLGIFGQSKKIYEELFLYEERLRRAGYMRVDKSEYGTATHHGGLFRYERAP